MGRHQGLIGTAFVALLAAVLTVTDIIVLRNYDISPSWYAWSQIAVVAIAWLAVWAWWRQRWWLAAVCLLAMPFAVWGYLYIPPLVALVTAGVAFARAIKRDRLEAPSPG